MGEDVGVPLVLADSCCSLSWFARGSTGGSKPLGSWPTSCITPRWPRASPTEKDSRSAACRPAFARSTRFSSRLRGSCRLGGDSVRRGQGDQHGRDDTSGDPSVPVGAALPVRGMGARRHGAAAASAGVCLYGHDHDRKRLPAAVSRRPLAFARALETPTLVWQIFAVAAALAAVAIRLQGLVSARGAGDGDRARCAPRGMGRRIAAPRIRHTSSSFCRHGSCSARCRR